MSRVQRLPQKIDEWLPYYFNSSRDLETTWKLLFAKHMLEKQFSLLRYRQFILPLVLVRSLRDYALVHLYWISTEMSRQQREADALTRQYQQSLAPNSVAIPVQFMIGTQQQRRHQQQAVSLSSLGIPVQFLVRMMQQQRAAAHARAGSGVRPMYQQQSPQLHTHTQGRVQAPGLAPQTRIVGPFTRGLTTRRLMTREMFRRLQAQQPLFVQMLLQRASVHLPRITQMLPQILERRPPPIPIFELVPPQQPLPVQILQRIATQRSTHPWVYIRDHRQPLRPSQQPAAAAPASSSMASAAAATAAAAAPSPRRPRRPPRSSTPEAHVAIKRSRIDSEQTPRKRQRAESAPLHLRSLHNTTQQAPQNESVAVGASSSTAALDPMVATDINTTYPTSEGNQQ